MRFFNKTRTLGLAASLTVGLIAWVISGDATNALILAVLGEIIALLIDLHLTVTNELDDFKRADALRSSLPASGANKPDLEAYVSDFATVSKTGNALFAEYARSQMVFAVKEMHSLAEGRMVVKPDQLLPMGNKILESLEVSGFATALGHLYDFWLLEDDESDPATQDAVDAELATDDRMTDDAKRNYQRQSLDAVKRRGIPITRVFLLESRNIVLHKAFCKLIEAQHEAGVDVRVAYVNLLPKDLVQDFAIWDDKLVARVAWNATPVRGPDGVKILTSTVGDTTYDNTKGELELARQQRDDLLQRSFAWSKVRSRHWPA